MWKFTVLLREAVRKETIDSELGKMEVQPIFGGCIFVGAVEELSEEVLAELVVALPELYVVTHLL